MRHREDVQEERPPESGSEIQLSIDELVVHGVKGVTRAELERALRRELGTLLASQPLQTGGDRTIELRRPLDMRLGQRDTGEQVGRKLAQTVHGALRKS